MHKDHRQTKTLTPRRVFEWTSFSEWNTFLALYVVVNLMLLINLGIERAFT